MPLNLDDNKKPYFKQLGLDETFDEISSAINSLEGGGFTETIVEISAAEILSAGTNYISLLPAPGAGNYYEIDKMIFEFLYESGFAYNDMNGDFFEIRYTQSGEKILCRIDGTLVSQAVPKVAIVKEFSIVQVLGMNSEIIVAPYLLNEEVHLGTFNYSNLTDNGQTAGMRVKIYSKIHTLGA